jgi:predicted nucleic acid-binding protein
MTAKSTEWLFSTRITSAFWSGVIAAIALVNDAMLLTQNERDFRPIAGLKTADWTR